MRKRDSFVLTSLFVVTACSPSEGTTTDEPGTTDGSTASTDEPTTGTSGEPTTGTSDEPTTGTTGEPACQASGPCDCQRVLVLGGQGSKSNAKFEAFLDQQVPGWQRVSDIDPLTAAALQDVDTLIVASLSRTYTGEEAAALRAWVEAGGGLITLAGYSGAPQGQNSLLAPLELQYETTVGYSLVDGFGAHPLAKGLTSLPFDGNHPVVDGKGDGAVVVFGEGKVYGLAATRGAGRVYVFADEWVTYDDQWGDQAEKFWDNALGWLNLADGSCGPQPLIPETCAEVQAEYPGALDGDYTLYVGKDPAKPWTADCKDMNAEPKEYLTLVKVEEGRNFSQYTANDQGETDVITRFTRVRIDPVTLIVDIDDLTFSSSTGEVDHSGPVTSMPYGVAEGCTTSNLADGVANIDLVGTPFKVIDPLCTGGAAAAGEAVFSNNDQVVDLTGGGFCGWTGPMKGDMCVFDPHSKNSGFVLDLEYIGLLESSHPESCAEVKAQQPDATDGEHTLYIGQDPSKPWTAYCHDMAADPKEYLPLVAVVPGRNFSVFAASDKSPGTDLLTHFTRLRIDPVTLLVDIDDLTFSSSEGEVILNGEPVSSMPYAVALGCKAENVVDSAANIDLVGTPFKVSETFCVGGFMPVGDAVFSSNDQIVELTGGGFCGWSGPANGDVCINTPQTKNSGFVLDLEYIAP